MRWAGAATTGATPTFRGGTLILEGTIAGGRGLGPNPGAAITAGIGLTYSNGAIDNRGQVSGGGITRTVAPGEPNHGTTGMNLTNADLINSGDRALTAARAPGQRTHGASRVVYSHDVA